MAESENNSFNTTHQLVEVVSPDAGVVLSADGDSANLTRNTRVVSDKVIFVDNVADSMTKEEFVDLVKLYAKRGPIVDVRFLRRTKGGSFAFIEFSSEEDGRDAISALNTKDFTTNSGKVLELRASKAENPTETVSNKNLYVRGIPKHWTNEDLKKRFRGFGSISHCRTLKKPGNEEENTGVGFVHFFHAIDAAKAIEGVEDQPVDPEDASSTGTLEVKFARAKKPRQRNRRRRMRGRSRGQGDFGPVPNWNFGRPRNGGGMRGHGGGRGGGMQRNRQGNWGMYPPNEEIWAKMVEVMQNMSMWQQNPYSTVYGQNYQYNYNPRTNSENNNTGHNTGQGF